MADFHEEFVISKEISSKHLKQLLGNLSQEDSAHSWKNIGHIGELKDLLRWENLRRPTEVFFFYLKRGRELQIVGTGSIAQYLNSHFTDPGFCVLGRCYIVPNFRGCGFYRRILRFRLEYCKARLGRNLKGIHIGSGDERIAHVITQQPLSGWPCFLHLGTEALSVADQTKLVNAYILLLPEFSQSLIHTLVGVGCPPALVDLHRRITNIGLSDIHNLGVGLRDALDDEESMKWLSGRDCWSINQLMAFCRAVPLVGFT